MAGGNIKGVTIVIDGDTSNLTKSLRNVDSETKNVQKELKQVESLLKFDPSNVDLLKQKQQLLGSSVEGVTQKLGYLKQAQAQVEQQFKSGEIGEEAFRKFQREIIATEGQLKAFKNQANNTKVKIDATVDAKGFEQLKSSMKDLGNQAKATGKEIASGLSTGAAAATAGVGALVIGSNDLNNDLARLRTNASLAGQDMGVLDKALTQIVSITGEADSGVETLSNILASGFQDNQLEQVIEGINGAAIKFSDTLKTEGIADGIQETFATGEAIGMFAELLERSGIDVKEFNKTLAEAKKEGTETDLVLQTMADLGLNDVTEKFKELNPELSDSNESIFEMQKSIADLAIVLTPLLTQLTEIITKFVDFAKENETLIKIVAILAAAITVITGAFKFLSPIISNSSKIMSVSIKVLKALRVVFVALSGPIGVIIGIVTALIAVGILLYKNWDTVSKNVVKAFKFMGTGITNARAAISKAVNDLVNSVVNYFKKNLNSMTLTSVGADVVKGLARGITGSIGHVRDAAAKLGNSVSKTVKNLLKIKSPSRVMMELGHWAGVGLADGLANTEKEVAKASTNVAKVVVNATKKNLASIKNIEALANKEKKKIQEKYADEIAKLQVKKASSNAKMTKKEREKEEKKYLATLKKNKEKRLALEKKMAKELQDLNAKTAKEVKAKQKALQQEQLAALKSYISDKKEANDLSLVEEAAYWREEYKQFKIGSKERIDLEKEYVKSVQAINESLNKINEDNLKKAKDIDTDMVDNVKRVNEEYEKAYEDRYKTVAGYYKLSDEVDHGDAASSETLTKNLRDQVYSLEEWQNLLKNLKDRKVVSDDLYKELEDLGVDAIQELRTLNLMTDEELSHFDQLFQQKMSVIKEITERDMKAAREAADAEIVKLKDDAVKQLGLLNQEWQKEIVKIVGGTETQLTTLNQVGKNAGQQLIDGMSSMNSDIAKQAKLMAEAISKTINKTLGLDKVVNLGGKGTSIGLNAAVAGGVLNGSSNTVKQTKENSSIIVNQQSQNNTDLINAVLKLANERPDVKLIVDGREIASIVNRNQYNTASLDSLTKGMIIG